MGQNIAITSDEKGIMKDEIIEMIRKAHEPPKIPRQKDISVIPLPSVRPANWIKRGDLVAFVLIDRRGKVRIRPGHICSWPGSHGAGMEVDNVKKTIVWSHVVLNDLADNADDAHEEGFDPKDPRLFRLDEIEYLKDPQRAICWFDGVYLPEVIREIARLLSLPDLGTDEELKDEAAWYEDVRRNAIRRVGLVGDD